MLVTTVSGLFFGCLLATVALTPAVMAFARKVDAVDRGGYRKVYEGAMPLLGGLAFATPLVVLGLTASFVGYVVIAKWQYLLIHWPHAFHPLMEFAQSRRDCLTLALGGAAIVGLGLADDVLGMRAKWKLLGQVVIASGICLSGYALASLKLPFFGDLNLGVWLGSAVAVLWIVGLINAFNLIDGIDGLAGGIALIGATALFALSFVHDNAFITLVAAAMAGSFLAFLLFNFPPARIFMGDTGSMFIGYSLATMTLMGTQKTEAAAILFTPMLALGLPIFETFVSIARRYLRGVPIFAGDNRHTHHRLLNRGYSQPRVVLTLYSAAALLATAAMLSAVMPENSPWIVLSYALYGGTLVYIAWLAGYLRPTAFKITIERRQRNKTYQALGRYAVQCVNGNGAPEKKQLLLELCRQELGLEQIQVCVQETEHPLLATQAKTEHAPEEELRVKASDGRDVRIGYTFRDHPDENRRQEVSFCLAGIFDQVNLGRFEHPGGGPVEGQTP
jgi:UDP-GlcNAc:undecaprenyl-phosphate GlcNAc-1-phosphate transferase